MKTPLKQVSLSLLEADARERAFKRGGSYYEKLDSHDGLNSGDWVMVRSTNPRGRSHAGEVKGFTVVNSKDSEPYVTIKVDFGGHSMERRYDRWKAEDFVGMASAEDVQNSKDSAMANQRWMSKNLNTGHEGT